MHNLFRLSSLASIEGFYFKPRMDRELLSRYGKGIIATTGCVGGEVQTRLRLGQYEEARKAAADFRDIFGAGNFYAEIMDHGIDIEKRTMNDLLRLAKELDLPAGGHQRPALHARARRDGARRPAVRAVGVDPRRPQPVQVRLRRVLPEERRPDACTSSGTTRRRATTPCSSLSAARSTSQHRDLMPRFPVPEGETEASWFEKEVASG